jgi:hypothetical protein
MATKLGQALWPYWLRTWDKATLFFLVDKITGKINGTSWDGKRTKCWF